MLHVHVLASTTEGRCNGSVPESLPASDNTALCSLYLFNNTHPQPPRLDLSDYGLHLPPIKKLHDSGQFPFSMFVDAELRYVEAICNFTNKLCFNAFLLFY